MTWCNECFYLYKVFVPIISYLYLNIIALCTLQVIGGVASDLYVGDLLYVPLRREWYYEVIITDIVVNDISLGLDCKEVSIHCVVC